MGIPEIRNTLQSFVETNKLLIQSKSSQVRFLNELMESEFTEPKLAAILFLQLYWKTGKETDIFTIVKIWFEKEWITDWNVCDWLCVRVLSPLLDSQPDLTAKALAQWNTSPNLWLARASLVPFAQCKEIQMHKKTIEQFSIQLIKREERFCKTAVGWVLREYSKYDPKFVRRFLKTHKSFTSAEVEKNAMKYVREVT